MQSRMLLNSAALLLSLASVGRAQVPGWVTDLLIAVELPVSAAQARTEGVPGDEVRAVLDAMRRASVPAHDARTVLDDARSARREHGPLDNFGAFVQARLDAGLRGRDLAAAIRAEHAARGKGRGAGNATKGQAGSRGKSDAPDSARATRGQKGATPGRPADAGKQPDTKGQSGKRPASPTR
jgi:hypothetical protein